MVIDRRLARRHPVTWKEDVSPTPPIPDLARARLGAVIEHNRAAVLDRLLSLAWAADPRDPHSMVRGPEQVRPRVELFLDCLLAGLRDGDWSGFELFIEANSELLRSGVFTTDDLNRRSLLLAALLIPYVLQEEDPAPVLEALISIMQSVSIETVARYNRALLVESQSLDELKTMFLRLTGHEFRAPLTTIRGYASLLQDGDLGPLDDGVLTALAAIDSAASSGLAMLDRLVEVARLESGAEALHRERQDLAELVASAVAPLREAARARGVRLEVDATGEAPVDAEEIAIAIRNLLGNALKYAADGGVVKVSAWRRDGHAEIEVADCGPGIPAEELDRLFERYYRTQHARDTGSVGSGLGLYIVRQIAELHGGEATVASSPGQGATFRLRLPAP
jgi:signal transduction histidine kinase